MLLFRYGPREQFAVALALVRRIEMISPGPRSSASATASSSPWTACPRRCCGSTASCPSRRAPTARNVPAAAQKPARPMGMLLSAVVDTAQLPVELHRDAVPGDGLLGSAVVRGQLTLFLDLGRLADAEMPPDARPRREALPGRRRRVLLVEDTQFFRQLVRGYLEDEGFEVVTAVNGAEGLERQRDADASTWWFPTSRCR